MIAAGSDGLERIGTRPVSVVLPCRNEARNLEVVLPRIPDWVEEVVVVDSGCTDDTVAVARRLRPDVVVAVAAGEGKGAALRAGFAVARCDYLVAMDADGSNDPAEIGAMLDALDAGAELVKGSRNIPGGGSDDTTVMRNLGNSVLCAVFNRIHRSRLTDLCYGFVAFRQDLAEPLLAGSAGFDVEAVLQTNAARAGLRIVEVPSHEARRMHGTSNLRPFRDGVRILGAILRGSRVAG
ncbi:MAG: glycosyltransferase family 2 protein [Microthrixaceae bacterium]